MLKDKVAVITGGSRGIGRAMLLNMRYGADIAIIYAGNSERGKNSERGLRVRRQSKGGINATLARLRRRRKQ